MRKRTSRWVATLAVGALGLLASRCGLDEGCGPGAVSVNPYVSDMIDLTEPLSGEVRERSRFATFTVRFSESVDRTTFSLADQIRVEFIADLFGDPPAEPAEVPGFFLPGVAWACEEHVTCKPGPSYDPDAADRLVLTVDPLVRDGFPGGAATPYYYLVDMLAKCGEEPDEMCTASPLLSHDGYPLEAPMRVFVGVVNDGEQSQAALGPTPYIAGFSPPELAMPQSYIKPHQKLGFRFSDRMGFVNFHPSDLAGLNLRYAAETPSSLYTEIESDSIQGLAPGRRYELRFVSSDLARELTPGIPPTVNRYGAALGLAGEAAAAGETRLFEFEAAHVSILFPFHEPFSDKPDPWDLQLAEAGWEQPVVYVNVAPGVTRLSPRRYVSDEPEIDFFDVTLDGSGGVVPISITGIRGRPENPDWTHRLRVHAFVDDQRPFDYRGYDELEVYHCPYPNLGDPYPVILDYHLPGSIYVPSSEFGQAADHDQDLLADALEAELAVKARPFLVLDEEEGCFFAGQSDSSLGWNVATDTQVFFQVRPVRQPGAIDPEDTGHAGDCRRADNSGRCAQYVQVTYVLAYQQDCGETSEGWGNHNGDLESVSLVLRTRDQGVSWEATEVAVEHHGEWTTYSKEELFSYLDPGPVQPCDGFVNPDDERIHRCEDQDGTRHIVVFVAENKHGNYLRVAQCETTVYSDGVWHADDCDGGLELMAPLPGDPLQADGYNVGEPESDDDDDTKIPWDCDEASQVFYGQKRIDGDLGAGGYGDLFLEWIWRKDYEERGYSVFCGGMRSARMRCLAFDIFRDCLFPVPVPDCDALKGLFCDAPYDLFISEPDCHGGIVENKLSQAPYCTCSE